MKSKKQKPSTQEGISPPTALPFKVRSRGRTQNTPYHSTRGTHHGDAMLTLVVGGTGYYRRRGHSQTLKAGMLGLVLPDHDPGILLADRHDPYDHFYCRFAGSEAMRIAERMAPAGHSRPFVAFPNWEDLADICHRLLRAAMPSASTPPERMTPVDAVLAELLTSLEWPRAARAQGITRGRLVRYMEGHISEPADLDRMAGYFSVSKAHLCRTARPLLGETVHRYWVTMRMAWAKTLMKDRSFSVGEVGRLVGYEDALYFSKVFKQQTGQSPRAWRSEDQ